MGYITEKPVSMSTLGVNAIMWTILFNFAKLGKHSVLTIKTLFIKILHVILRRIFVCGGLFAFFIKIMLMDMEGP